MARSVLSSSTSCLATLASSPSILHYILLLRRRAIFNLFKVIVVDARMYQEECFIVFLLFFLECSLLCSYSFSPKRCNAIVNDFENFLISKQNFHLFAPFVIVLRIKNWKVGRDLIVGNGWHVCSGLMDQNQESWCQMLEHTQNKLVNQWWKMADWRRWSLERNWRLLERQRVIEEKISKLVLTQTHITRVYL